METSSVSGLFFNKAQGKKEVEMPIEQSEEGGESSVDLKITSEFDCQHCDFAGGNFGELSQHITEKHPDLPDQT